MPELVSSLNLKGSLRELMDEGSMRGIPTTQRESMSSCKGGRSMRVESCPGK